MLRGVINVLKNSSSKELKIINPELHSILSKERFTETSVEKFIQELEGAQRIDGALKNLLSSHDISDSVIEELNKDLKNLNSIMVLRDFIKTSDVLKDLNIDRLPETSSELNELITTNKDLNSKVKQFIKIVNKHKIKLSVISLTLTSVGTYLFDAAKNMSGCYKYSILPSKEYKLICKVRRCGFNKELDLSINDIYCNEPCISHDCNTNCTNKTTQSHKYTCVTLQWHDVLSIVTKRFGDGFGSFISQSFKYLMVFIIVFCIYYITKDLELFYRIASIIITTIITLFITR